MLFTIIEYHTFISCNPKNVTERAKIALIMIMNGERGKYVRHGSLHNTIIVILLLIVATHLYIHSINRCSKYENCV